LYVDGVPVAEAAGDESIARARPGTESGMPALYIGSDPDGAAPFLGTMALPEMSVLGWYPSEIMWAYTRAMPLHTTSPAVRAAQISLVASSDASGGGAGRLDVLFAAAAAFLIGAGILAVFIGLRFFRRRQPARHVRSVSKR
jgi:hypothetical protein